MPFLQDAVVLKIYAGESDRYENLPLYEAIVRKAREVGLAGATVLRSPMGFGASSRIHTAKILTLSADLPVVVEIVDGAEEIRKFVEDIQPLLKSDWSGLITMENIRVLHYGKHK
jgi:PII-like signaling protein